MAMPPAATVAALICGDLGLTGTEASTAALANFTAIVTRIQAMISAGTVNVTVATTDSIPAAGLVAPAGGGPVTGAAAGTGTGTGTGTLT